MRIKIVKDDAPNEDGKWVELSKDDEIRLKLELRRFMDLCLQQFAPTGYHIVQVERDGEHYA